MAATDMDAVVPSGNVTLTVEPGSPRPETVSVPLAFGADVTVGAKGAVVSAKIAAVAGDVFPAASLSTTEMVPLVCGATQVAV